LVAAFTNVDDSDAISTLLCATSVFSVSLWLSLFEKHHRDTENTEVAQRIF